MPTYERALTALEQRDFNRYAAVGIQMIGIGQDAAPVRIIGAINAFIDRHQRAPGRVRGSLPGDGARRGNAEAARALGTVWGDQLVREFGWEWISVVFEGEEHHVVVRPDRALVIFAADHVEECMDAGTPDCMVRLVFDLLRTDTIPPQAALSYASVMALARQLPAPTVSTLAVDSAPERLARFIRKVGALVPANERAHEGRNPSADAASAAR